MTINRNSLNPARKSRYEACLQDRIFILKFAIYLYSEERKFS